MRRGLGQRNLGEGTYRARAPAARDIAHAFPRVPSDRADVTGSGSVDVPEKREPSVFAGASAQGTVRGMKDPLVRFGVAIERSLLRQIDGLANERGCTRSELFRDLGRGAIGRAQVARGAPAFATLTLVYDHHVRDLSERLTELQHQLGDGVRSAMHVHLSHDLCLEVVVMRGLSHELQELAEKILAMRGVKQGGIEIIPLGPAPAHDHRHEHAHPHTHTHDDADEPILARPASRREVKTSPAREPVRGRAQRKRN